MIITFYGCKRTLRSNNLRSLKLQCDYDDYGVVQM